MPLRRNPPTDKPEPSEEERRELLRFTASRSVPQSVALRARIILGAADGVGNKVLARQLATSLPTVLLWRGRYQTEGLLGILEEWPRWGRPKEIAPEQEAALPEMTLRTTPKDATQLERPVGGDAFSRCVGRSPD